MSGSCNDCGNVMCLCDSEGDDFEGVLSSGIIISNERYEKLIEEIQKRDTEIVKLKEDNSRFKADNLNLRLILQKLQRDLDRDEHVDGFWMKDLFPEAQEIELLKHEIQKRDELLNTALKHLDMTYKWGLWIYESEDYQEMEDDDEKDNMGSDLDIVCSFLNTNKGSER